MISIRKFLLVNLLIAIAATVILTAVGDYFVSEQDIETNLDNLLSQAALSFQTLAGEDIQSRDIQALQQNLNKVPSQTIAIFNKNRGLLSTQLDYREPYQFQIWDSHGKLVLHSANAPAASLAGATTGFSDNYVNGNLWRVFTSYDPKSKLTFVAAEHYKTRTYLARRISVDDIIIILLAFPFAGLLIWVIIGRGLNSIERVTKEVARRAADHLEPVDLKAVPTEIKPLVDELNKLFLRLKQAFEREQRFAADAAHELRTPLAALKTMAQVALKTADSRDRQTQLQNLCIGVDRCTHIIQQLLTLCRISPETATLEDPSEVDLLKVATEVIGQIAPAAIDKRIEIELAAKQPHCILVGNATGIYALVRNLVDNAVRYTPAGGAVKVQINDEGSYAVIRVIDNGPGIPTELRSRVFERFYRVLGTNVQGSGLGLAIVQQIVHLHNGEVTLRVPEHGSGLEVEVRLPKGKYPLQLAKL